MPESFPYVGVLLVMMVEEAALVSAAVKPGITAGAVSHGSLCTAESQPFCRRMEPLR